MKNLVFGLLLVNFCLNANDVVLPEATVAVVNGTAITDDELDREVTRLLPRSYYHATVTDEKKKALEEKALKTLIENSLLYSYAISKKIEADEDKVEEIIEKSEDAYGSEDKFLKALEKAGFTLKEFKKTIRKELVLKELNKKEIEYSATDKDLKEYYEKNKYKFKEPEKIKVSMIYVRNNPTDKNGTVRAKYRIKQAMDMLEKGENFAYVAQTFSDDPSRVMGGDMGFLHRGRLDPSVEDVAFSMDVNTTSGVVEKDIGCFIVRVEDKKAQNQLKFEEIKGSLSGELKTKEEKSRKAKLLEKLMSDAVIIKK